MKKITSLFLCCLLLVLLAPQVSAKDINVQVDDIKTMSMLGLDTNKITNIKHFHGHTSYLFDYGDYSETIDIKQSVGSTKFVFSNGNITNEVIISDNGDIFLDGNEVHYKKDRLLGGWKSVYKGFSPYGSLTQSSYSKRLSSGTEDIALGKALDQITAGALSTILSLTSFWVGITVSISGTALSVYNTLKSANPKTEYLGCKYTTWIAGSSDYKYVCDYYANKQCTGTNKRVIIYEHFRVY